MIINFQCTVFFSWILTTVLCCEEGDYELLYVFRANVIRGVVNKTVSCPKGNLCIMDSWGYYKNGKYVFVNLTTNSIELIENCSDSPKCYIHKVESDVTECWELSVRYTCNRGGKKCRLEIDNYMPMAPRATPNQDTQKTDTDSLFIYAGIPAAFIGGLVLGVILCFRRKTTKGPAANQGGAERNLVVSYNPAKQNSHARALTNDSCRSDAPSAARDYLHALSTVSGNLDRDSFDSDFDTTPTPTPCEYISIRDDYINIEHPAEQYVNVPKASDCDNVSIKAQRNTRPRSILPALPFRIRR